MSYFRMLFSICALVVFSVSFTYAEAYLDANADFQPYYSIEEIQAKINEYGYDFTVAHNWVFDMDPEQKANFLSRHPSLEEPSELSEEGPLVALSERDLPTSFDWRSTNGHTYIGPVRDQGNCGSCYSFGACDAAEGTYNFATGRYDLNCVDFSESYIMWCLGRLSQYSSHFFGCDGADYSYSELTALVNDGITYESNFPYQESDPGSCTHYGDPIVRFQSWYRIPCSDTTAIKTAIMTYGVVDVAVYVDSAFEAYSSGIYQNSSTTCSSNPCYNTATNHAVGLVGWNDNGGNGYWILRNSWGPSWGESGYMRIKYTSARVACEACYLVYGTAPSPTPAPATNTPTRTFTPLPATYTPTRTPTRTPTSAAATYTPTRTPTQGAYTYTPTRTPTRTPTQSAYTYTPTRTPTRTPTPAGATILLVDDDNGSTYETYYQTALTTLGKTYTRVVGSPTLAQMNAATLVIWFTGDDYSTTLTATDQANLASYLNGGGKLFLTGQDIGYDIWNDGTFMNTYLHASYLKDDTNYYALTGANLMAGVSINISGTGGANNQNYPDSLAAATGGSLCFNYANGDGAGGISYSGTYRVVYFGFGFEAINSATSRTTVMSKVLNFLTGTLGNL